MQTQSTPRVARPRYRFLVIFAAVVITACQQQEAPPAFPPAEVGVVEVQPQALPLVLEYPAQLRGAREVEVRARVSGILLERRYQEGAHVAAGDLLFLIDPDPFRADVARARADVAVQEASFGQARRERDRIVPLYDQKLASLRDRDTALAAFESAEAGVAAARASLRTAELALSYTEVRAPIDGLTSREVRSEGSLVTAGGESSLLTYIVQADRLYVDFSVPDTDADLVRTALAMDHAAAVGVRVSNAQGHAIGGRAPIEFVSPRVDDSTGTVAIRAVLDNPDGIVPGRIVRARIEGVSVPESLVVPKRAVMHGAQGAYVWVVEGGMAVSTPVELGTPSGNNVVVLAGLNPGNRVVVDGIMKVIPGVPVNAVPSTQNTAQNAVAAP